MNPARAFQDIAARLPDTVALRADGNAWRFKELAWQAASLAAALRAGGIGRGDLVVTRFENPVAELAAFFALMHVGAVNCSIAHLGGAAIEVAPIAVLGDAETLPALQRALPDSRPVEYEAALRSEHPLADFAPVTPGEVSQLILTSGTTGRAKMVQLTYGAIAARTATRETYFKTVGAVLLLMGPMTAGGCQAVLSTLFSGHALDLSRQRQGLIDAIADPSTRHVIASPVQLSALLAVIGAGGTPHGHLRGILLMGGAAPPTLIAKARQAFACPITCMYGTSEAGACASVTLDSAEAARDAVLAPLSGVRIEVVDDADRPLPPGEVGHVRIAAPGMASGYFGDPALTRAHFRDGWFHPGDLGRLLGDGLVIAGRQDEMINIGGVKLDPAEIDRMIEERKLAQDAAAFRFDDGSGIERLMVASVTENDAAFARLREAIAAHVGGRLPVGHFRVNRIPRNEMGKPLRLHLAEALRRKISGQV